MNDTNRRLFLTITICLAVAYGWSVLFQPKRPAAGDPAAVHQPQAGPPAGAAPASPAADVPRGTAAPSPATLAVTPPGSAAPRAPAQEIALDSAKLRLVLSTDGAVLKSAMLKGAKFRKPSEKGKEGGQVDLVAANTRPFPLATELRSAEAGAQPLVPADAPYQIVSHDEHTAVLRTTAGGVTLTKTFAVDPSTYRMNIKLDVQSANALIGQLLVLQTGHGEAASGGMFSAHAPPSQTICQAGGKLERVATGAKHASWDGPGPASFAGIDEQYFLQALVPDPQSGAACHTEAQPAGTLIASLALPVSLAAGGQTSRSLSDFLGPKDTDELVAVAAPLREAVDFGFWSVIASFLLAVMKFFYKVVPPHNWGVAIILLTVAVKLVTFPLQHRSMKSMQEMQRIQPQLEEMKKKYAGDTQRQNLEQMKLFKEHGVNPMGSCLPMVIQMPVWFALYKTLGVSVELYNSVFIPGWLNDLTARDPYFILPVAMGITMIVTQILTPSPMSNPGQKTIGYVMSGFFSLLMLNLPSGLTLYIFINNILSITQQIYLRRTMGGPPAASRTVAVSAQRA
ncbi:MAG: membrane protein insertase YidC [Myxococcales bacterium]